MIRFGSGYDSHIFENAKEKAAVNEKPLVLCGKKISDEFSVIAHSDGDVVLHALIDAILSSIGEKDIGSQFPDTDKKYEGANSVDLLRKVLPKLENKKIVQVNIILILDEPKIAPHVDAMKEILKKEIGIENDRISIAAKTTESKNNPFAKFPSNKIEAFAHILVSEK